MKTPLHLFCMMFVQYGVLTVNMRAISSGNYLGLFLTDLVVAILGFTILKKVEQASTKTDMMAYALGGAIGAQAALFISLRLFK